MPNKNHFTTPDGLILNMVTCGVCGEVFAHVLERKTLTCPYCKRRKHGDICEFPDLYTN
jgi:hypothetical protein